MDTLLFSLNAVLPILLLLGLGYILKRTHFLDEHFLQVGNKFVFRIALPVYLFYTIYSIKNITDINWPIIIFAVIAILILFVAGIIIALLTIKDDRKKGVVVQAIFRANYAIIGIPLADAIGGTEAVAVVALISAVIVPLLNILSVIALSLFVKNEDENVHPLKATIIKIIKNPLIIGIFLGLFVLWIRSYIPVDANTGELVFSIKNNLKPLYFAIEKIGQVASPFALIVLGGTFEFLAVMEMRKQIFIGTFSRIVIAPLLILPLAVILSKNTILFHFSAVEFPALIALIASPTAVTSAIMAKEMNNDEKLAVQLVVWTTLLSILSIFIIVFIFRSLNLI